MLKLLTLLLVSTFSAISHAATVDWTLLLQSMKRDCAFDLEALPYEKSEIDRLPTKYRTSVLRSHNKQMASGSEVLTIELKNSVAFGQPLSALTIESNEGYGYVKMKFARNADVSKLIPLFTIPTNKQRGILAVGMAKNFCAKDVNGTLTEYQSSQRHWRAVSTDGPWQEFRYHPKENALSFLRSDQYGDELRCPK